jgi:hypothetical protein
MKAVLKYERNSSDTKIIFSILAKKKIKIIKTSDFCRSNNLYKKL